MKYYACQSLNTSLIVALLIGGIIAIKLYLILLVFKNIGFNVRDTGSLILISFGSVFFMVLKFSIMIVGMLRTGGDTKFSLFIEVSTF